MQLLILLIITAIFVLLSGFFAYHDRKTNNKRAMIFAAIVTFVGIVLFFAPQFPENFYIALSGVPVPGMEGIVLWFIGQAVLVVGLLEFWISRNIYLKNK